MMIEAAFSSGVGSAVVEIEVGMKQGRDNWHTLALASSSLSKRRTSSQTPNAEHANTNANNQPRSSVSSSRAGSSPCNGSDSRSDECGSDEACRTRTQSATISRIVLCLPSSHRLHPRFPYLRPSQIFLHSSAISTASIPFSRRPGQTLTDRLESVSSEPSSHRE